MFIEWEGNDFLNLYLALPLQGFGYHITTLLIYREVQNESKVTWALDWIISLVN